MARSREEARRSASGGELWLVAGRQSLKNDKKTWQNILTSTLDDGILMLTRKLVNEGGIIHEKR